MAKRKRNGHKGPAQSKAKPRPVAEDFFSPIPKVPTSLLKRDCSPVEASRWDTLRVMEPETRGKILTCYGLEVKPNQSAGQDAARIVTEERARASRGVVVPDPIVGPIDLSRFNLDSVEEVETTMAQVVQDAKEAATPVNPGTIKVNARTHCYICTSPGQTVEHPVCASCVTRASKFSGRSSSSAPITPSSNASSQSERHAAELRALQQRQALESKEISADPEGKSNHLALSSSPWVGKLLPTGLAVWQLSAEELLFYSMFNPDTIQATAMQQFSPLQNYQNSSFKSMSMRMRPNLGSHVFTLSPSGVVTTEPSKSFSVHPIASANEAADCIANLHRLEANFRPGQAIMRDQQITRQWLRHYHFQDAIEIIDRIRFCRMSNGLYRKLGLTEPESDTIYLLSQARPSVRTESAKQSDRDHTVRGQKDECNFVTSDNGSETTPSESAEDTASESAEVPL
jgi:hypothetical protein